MPAGGEPRTRLYRVRRTFHVAYPEESGFGGEQVFGLMATPFVDAIRPFIEETGGELATGGYVEVREVAPPREGKPAGRCNLFPNCSPGHCD